MIKCIFEKKFIGAEYCAECPIVCPLYTFGIVSRPEKGLHI